MQLVIVESPTKARKLKGYLDASYQIEASVGHIRDLPKSGLGVDIDNNFEPVYEVNEDKTDVVNKLVKLAKKADQVILATDPDREGEAIAWHLQFLLKDSVAKGVTAFKRATFHEITKQAVVAAINKPGKLNQDLVDAQQARRVVDRLVGYKVSPVLWKKIRRGLSAGRVQSVALRLIVEREKEIAAFKPEEYWELDTLFSLDTSKATKPTLHLSKKTADSQETPDKPAWLDEVPANHFVGRVHKVNDKVFDPKTQETAQPIADLLAASTSKHAIQKIERKERKRSSLPPFSTSTLQQQAATRLGMTSKQTMRLAQQLYEEGLITYHRTDSFSLSQQSISMARNYVDQVYGSQYLPAKPRVFASSSKNAQEAHEAIRITDTSVKGQDILQVSSKMTNRHQQLYDLIWRRFVASQMETAVYDQTTFVVESTNSDAEFSSIKTIHSKATGSVLRFDGWMKLFPGSGDTILPEVHEQQQVLADQVFAAQKYTQPPARYNDASLVKELEKRGIGRPSTYASIISVIEDRGYVTRDAKRFMATPIGMTVCDFLVKHFDTIMDYDFTAEMEEDLDRIARGEKEWRTIISEFFTPFAKKIETVEETADRAKVPVEKTGEHCPECAEGEIVIRSGRFGKFKSCSRFPECKFTENIVEKLGDQHCPLCKEGDIIIRKSRWGKEFYGCSRYPECDWASWAKPAPDLTLTQAEWKKMQAERAERMAKRKGKAGTKPSKGRGKKASFTSAKSTTKKVAKKSVAKKSTVKKSK